MRIKEKNPEVPASSMADIAFLLLVFFLLTTTIDQEIGLYLNLPDDNIDVVMVPPKNLDKILINASGKILYEGQPMILENLLQHVKNRNQLNPNLIFEIVSNRETEYGIYIKVLDIIKQAEAKKISVLIE